MILQVIPNVHRNRLHAQRLIVQLNSVTVGEFDCAGSILAG
jgi:hypothetical protein